MNNINAKQLNSILFRLNRIKENAESWCENPAAIPSRFIINIKESHSSWFNIYFSAYYPVHDLWIKSSKQQQLAGVGRVESSRIYIHILFIKIDFGLFLDFSYRPRNLQARFTASVGTCLSERNRCLRDNERAPGSTIDKENCQKGIDAFPRHPPNSIRNVIISDGETQITLLILLGDFEGGTIFPALYIRSGVKLRVI